MNNKAFGEHISKLRKEKNLTQKELAEKVFVGDKAISKWETGKSFPDLSTISLLAEALDVNIVELLQIQDENSVTGNTDTIQTMINQSNKKATTKYKVLLVASLVIFVIVGYMATRKDNKSSGVNISNNGGNIVTNLMMNSDPKILYSPINDAIITCTWGCYQGFKGTTFINNDLKNGKSTNVYSIADGYVFEIGLSESEGYWFVIVNEEFKYLYAHLDNLDGIDLYTEVKAGELLLQKNPVNSGWTTGPCIKVIIYENDNAIEPMDIVLLNY